MIGVLLVLSASSGSSGLYEWTDDDGRVHYTNEPRPGADPVGLEPLALEAEDSPKANEIDRKRRTRLEILEAEKWVDRQDTFPTPDAGTVMTEAETRDGVRPAAPGPDLPSKAEQVCQHRHGMSCLQYQVYMQGPGKACRKAGSGAGCLTNAEYNEQQREAARQRDAEEAAWRAKRLKLED